MKLSELAEAATSGPHHPLYVQRGCCRRPSSRQGHVLGEEHCSACGSSAAASRALPLDEIQVRRHPLRARSSSACLRRDGRGRSPAAPEPPAPAPMPRPRPSRAPYRSPIPAASASRAEHWSAGAPPAWSCTCAATPTRRHLAAEEIRALAEASPTTPFAVVARPSHAPRPPDRPPPRPPRRTAMTDHAVPTPSARPADHAGRARAPARVDVGGEVFGAQAVGGGRQRYRNTVGLAHRGRLHLPAAHDGVLVGSPWSATARRMVAGEGARGGVPGLRRRHQPGHGAAPRSERRNVFTANSAPPAGRGDHRRGTYVQRLAPTRARCACPSPCGPRYILQPGRRSQRSRHVGAYRPGARRRSHLAGHRRGALRPLARPGLRPRSAGGHREPLARHRRRVAGRRPPARLLPQRDGGARPRRGAARGRRARGGGRRRRRAHRERGRPGRRRTSHHRGAGSAARARARRRAT